MATSSRLCVDHVEEIGTHYYPTLRCWRANFLQNQSKILALGFNQEFIRTLEYYFDSTAAGFKTQTLLNYQYVGTLREQLEQLAAERTPEGSPRISKATLSDYSEKVETVAANLASLELNAAESPDPPTDETAVNQKTTKTGEQIISLSPGLRRRIG